MDRSMSTINTQLLAIKKAPYYETQGFITPILQVTPDGDYVPLDRTLYPVDIFISKGYGAIDKGFVA